MKGLKYTNIEELGQVKRGKVRDVYDLGKELLIISSDRISAFDVIMNEAIPGKGIILNQISKFWFEKTKGIINNHYISDDLSNIDKLKESDTKALDKRSMIVKKTKVFPIECVVRGYIAGSGWKEYLQTQAICGNKLPKGLVEFQKLGNPIFTPATKAEEGHDENISFEQMCEIIGYDNSEFLKNKSIELYKFASEYLDSKGIIIADTKFEFGLTDSNEIILIDEALTPDSSRFWLKELYKAGTLQYNFDKQILRDYLLSLNWDKTPPPPTLPADVINDTLQKYKEAYFRITEEEIIL